MDSHVLFCFPFLRLQYDSVTQASLEFRSDFLLCCTTDHGS